MTEKDKKIDGTQKKDKADKYKSPGNDRPERARPFDAVSKLHREIHDEFTATVSDERARSELSELMTKKNRKVGAPTFAAIGVDDDHIHFFAVTNGHPRQLLSKPYSPDTDANTASVSEESLKNEILKATYLAPELSGPNSAIDRAVSKLEGADIRLYHALWSKNGLELRNALPGIDPEELPSRLNKVLSILNPSDVGVRYRAELDDPKTPRHLTVSWQTGTADERVLLFNGKIPEGK